MVAGLYVVHVVKLKVKHFLAGPSGEHFNATVADFCPTWKGPNTFA